MATAVNAFLMCTSAVVGLFSPIAVVGNALVLTAILREPSLKTPSNILLAGLAFTDFGTRLISQPFCYKCTYGDGVQRCPLGYEHLAHGVFSFENNWRWLMYLLFLTKYSDNSSYVH